MPFNVAFTQFIPLHYNLMQGHRKVRGSTATSKRHAGRKRDLRKKASILLLQLIVLSSMSWLYATKETQTISYRPTIAYALLKYDISSCLPSMFLSMSAELSKFCRASPQSKVHALLNKSFASQIFYHVLCIPYVTQKKSWSASNSIHPEAWILSSKCACSSH